MTSIFSYTKRNTPVHNTEPVIKLLILLIGAFTVYRASVALLSAYLLIGLVLIVISKVPFSDYAHDFKPSVFFAFLIVLSDVLSYFVFRSQDVIISHSSLMMIYRLCVTLLLSSVFFRTTSYYQLRESLRRIEDFVTHNTSRHLLSTVFTLFLSFLPKLFAIYSDISLSYDNRFQGRRKGPLKTARTLSVLITMAFKKADDTFISLSNRLDRRS